MLTRLFCIGVAAAGLWAATGCSQQAAAIRVGDSHVSFAEFTKQLETMKTLRVVAVEQGQADPAALEGLEGELGRSFSRTFGAEAGQPFLAENVQNRITTLLMSQLFEDADLEITGQDRAIVRQQLEPAIPGFQDFKGSEQDRILEEEAMFQALQRHTCPDFVPTQGQAMCPDLASAVQDLYQSSDIEVSSKLGSWDKASGSLVPPDGPLVQSSNSEDGEAPAGSPLGTLPG